MWRHVITCVSPQEQLHAEFEHVSVHAHLQCLYLCLGFRSVRGEEGIVYTEHACCFATHKALIRAPWWAWCVQCQQHFVVTVRAFQKTLQIIMYGYSWFSGDIWKRKSAGLLLRFVEPSLQMLLLLCPNCRKLAKAKIPLPFFTLSSFNSERLVCFLATEVCWILRGHDTCHWYALEVCP